MESNHHHRRHRLNSSTPAKTLFSSFMSHHRTTSSMSVKDSAHLQQSSSLTTGSSFVPHRGSLVRMNDGMDSSYVIEIVVVEEEEEETIHELVYNRHDFEFGQKLFAILDTESRGLVSRTVVKEFAQLRCPVFWRRDDDLRRLRGREDAQQNMESPTFDEIWSSVVISSKVEDGVATERRDENCELGIEGWLVFCRLVALAQYLEAKRRFSARHLQQTMRHRNAPRGSEVVVVDVPPPEPPASLSPVQLATYERKNKAPLPLPELDLDHSLVAAHDASRKHDLHKSHGLVKVSLFSPTISSNLIPSTTSSSSVVSASSKTLDFALTYSKKADVETSLLMEDVVVRRSMDDLKWLDDTFSSHRVLGGTLCGRILPPFPGRSQSSSSVLASHFQKEDSVITTSIKTTGGAINTAAAGVGRLRDAAKSFLNSYVNNSSQGQTCPGEEGQAPAPVVKKQPKKKSCRLNLSLPENYYNPNSPVCKARHLERYLNYLLEHPSLCTSFPLNTILKASQSGLEAAKEALDECTRLTREMSKQAPQLGNDRGMAWSSYSPNSPSFAWVRTAAQAAMALKVHGMLETTGMQAASARLQHASLPTFDNRNRGPGWEEDVEVAEGTVDETTEVNDFEEGVVNVYSALVSEVPQHDGYDLLPLPVPAPERSILSAGSETNQASERSREGRFHYGSTLQHGRLPVEGDDTPSAFLGEISVDENIDKLHEVIASVDNTLSRSLASIGRVGKAQRDRQSKHLEVVRGLDSWSGMRGRFVSQRSLMKGVAGLEQSREVREESDLALIDDITWQTSLANAAVTAADDVRKAVRVSRTASNAKAAASSAAMAAQSVCENGSFANIDEARAAQTRASIAQSHAIHAAVVEHETKTVKRRAALALAHDVKCWNMHRKRELLKSCLAYARSQHEATRRAVDAWSGLRDGFIGSTVIPSALDRKPSIPSMEDLQVEAEVRREPVVEQDEVSAVIFDNNNSTSGSDGQPAIIAVEHNILSNPAVLEENTASFSDDIEKSVPDINEPTLILPFAAAAPIPDEYQDDEEKEPLPSNKDEGRTGDLLSLNDLNNTSGHDDKLSASMQSLVDGLMSWGGGFDTEEEHLALPRGMATSIVMEESNVLGTSSNTIA